MEQNFNTQFRRTTSWLICLHIKLCLSDEINLHLLNQNHSGLLESLESTNRPDSKDKKPWLKLHGGKEWGRDTKARTCNISATRVNYTGNYKLFKYQSSLQLTQKVAYKTSFYTAKNRYFEQYCASNAKSHSRPTWMT